MSVAVTHVEGFAEHWSAKALPGAPMIAPARQYVFPMAVAGEEEALARGALWLEVKPADAAVFLAQCALGFAGAGVATGVWATPRAEVLLAVAGGYAYAIDTAAPEQTTLLPMRPVVQVVTAPSAGALVMVGFHGVLVFRADAMWESPRLSWEGIAVTGVEGDVLHGTGWHMRTDTEVPFALNLRTRELSGGGFTP